MDGADESADLAQNGRDRRTLDIDTVGALGSWFASHTPGETERPVALIDLVAPYLTPIARASEPTMKTLLTALSLAASLAASPSFAQAVSGFGGFKPLPEAGEQPDPSRVYRVIFDVSQGGPDDRPLKGLDRVARLTNMLAAGGVDDAHRQIVVVLHGAATTAVLSDAAWVARGRGAANPNSALIRALLAAGVQVRLCGQAMAGNGVTEAELGPGVTVDLAALMTVIHHQQAGYALIVN